MARGGARPGSGRPKGVKDKLAREAAEAHSRKGITPLEYMLSVLRDDLAESKDRLEAAKAAAPYMHPKLQPVDRDGDTTQRLEVKGAFEWNPPQ